MAAYNKNNLLTCFFPFVEGINPGGEMSPCLNKALALTGNFNTDDSADYVMLFNFDQLGPYVGKVMKVTEEGLTWVADVETPFDAQYKSGLLVSANIAIWSDTISTTNTNLSGRLTGLAMYDIPTDIPRFANLSRWSTKPEYSRINQQLSDGIVFIQPTKPRRYVKAGSAWLSTAIAATQEPVWDTEHYLAPNASVQHRVPLGIYGPHAHFIIRVSNHSDESANLSINFGHEVITFVLAAGAAKDFPRIMDDDATSDNCFIINTSEENQAHITIEYFTKERLLAQDDDCKFLCYIQGNIGIKNICMNGYLRYQLIPRVENLQMINMELPLEFTPALFEAFNTLVANYKDCNIVMSRQEYMDLSMSSEHLNLREVAEIASGEASLSTFLKGAVGALKHVGINPANIMKRGISFVASVANRGVDTLAANGYAHAATGACSSTPVDYKPRRPKTRGSQQHCPNACTHQQHNGAPATFPKGTQIRNLPQNQAKLPIFDKDGRTKEDLPCTKSKVFVPVVNPVFHQQRLPIVWPTDGKIYIIAPNDQKLEIVRFGEGCATPEPGATGHCSMVTNSGINENVPTISPKRRKDGKASCGSVLPRTPTISQKPTQPHTVANYVRNMLAIGKCSAPMLPDGPNELDMKPQFSKKRPKMTAPMPVDNTQERVKSSKARVGDDSMSIIDDAKDNNLQIIKDFPDKDTIAICEYRMDKKLNRRLSAENSWENRPDEYNDGYIGLAPFLFVYTDHVHDLPSSGNLGFIEVTINQDLAHGKAFEALDSDGIINVDKSITVTDHAGAPNTLTSHLDFSLVSIFNLQPDLRNFYLWAKRAKVRFYISVYAGAYVEGAKPQFQDVSWYGALLSCFIGRTTQVVYALTMGVYQNEFLFFEMVSLDRKLDIITNEIHEFWPHSYLPAPVVVAHMIPSQVVQTYAQLTADFPKVSSIIMAQTTQQYYTFILGEVSIEFIKKYVPSIMNKYYNIESHSEELYLEAIADAVAADFGAVITKATEENRSKPFMGLLEQIQALDGKKMYSFIAKILKRAFDEVPSVRDSFKAIFNKASLNKEYKLPSAQLFLQAYTPFTRIGGIDRAKTRYEKKANAKPKGPKKAVLTPEQAAIRSTKGGMLDKIEDIMELELDSDNEEEDDFKF